MAIFAFLSPFGKSRGVLLKSVAYQSSPALLIASVLLQGVQTVWFHGKDNWPIKEEMRSMFHQIGTKVNSKQVFV